jgi:hypothetical protein
MHKKSEKIQNTGDLGQVNLTNFTISSFGGYFPITKTFDLSFQETKFTVPKGSLFNFFNHPPDLMTAASYDVKSTVRREIFQVFVKALGTGSKVPVTKQNVVSISLLTKEFWLEELFSECSALISSSVPELIAVLSEGIVKLESQTSSHRSTFTKHSHQLTKLENQTCSHHFAVIPEVQESIAQVEQQQERLYSVCCAPVSPSPTIPPIPPVRFFPHLLQFPMFLPQNQAEESSFLLRRPRQWMESFHILLGSTAEMFTTKELSQLLRSRLILMAQILFRVSLISLPITLSCQTMSQVSGSAGISTKCASARLITQSQVTA